MRGYILVLAGLGAVVLAAGAFPAFSADGGTVQGTVTAAAPPAPCIALSTTTVDFGTLSFTDPATGTAAYQDAAPEVTYASCSTAAETLYMAATDATLPSGGTWENTDSNAQNPCSVGPNVYMAAVSVPVMGFVDRVYKPRPDGSFVSVVGTIPAGNPLEVTMRLAMPCRGSAGAGETASMSFLALAVVV